MMDFINSTFGLNGAQNKYVALKVLKALVRDLVNAKYDHGKFKLICDNLGFANLIIRGEEDLTVVGVVGLEWSYVGPAQLFGSAPWWHGTIRMASRLRLLSGRKILGLCDYTYSYNR